MSNSIFTQVINSLFANLWEIIIIAIIFYFTFKSAVKNAIRKVVREEIIKVLNENNGKQLY